MNGISVIVPTFNNVQYIENCIKSIEKSFSDLNYSNYEILIGIDSCTKTLEFINYNNYLKKNDIFYFLENKGPYLIKNSLSQIAKYDRLLFFDSDDLMKKDFISEIIKYNNIYKAIRFSFKNFTDENRIERNTASLQVADGVISIDKNFFKEINGYYPWICGADTEIIGRISTKQTIYRSMAYSFDRRLHDTNLTRKKETNFASPVRKNIASLIEQLKHKKYPNPENFFTNKFVKVEF